MFKKLFGWLSGGGRGDLYHPRDRLIYRYFDGQREVAADPMVLYKLLMDVGPEIGIDMKVAASPSKDAGKAHDKMVQKIRGAFGVLPLKDGGLTDLESVELLQHFLVFVDAIKKNSSPLPTSPGETPAPSAPSSVAGPPTPSSSGSGSTGGGSSTVGPPPSPSGPPPPSAP